MNVNQAKEGDGSTSLTSSCRGSHSTIVKKLLAASANVNQRKDGGITALHIACGTNNFEIVQLLIDARCDLDIGNDTGGTSFFLACVKGFTKIVALLIDSGCDIEKAATIDGEQWTPLQGAISDKNTDIVNLINATTKKRKKKAYKKRKDEEAKNKKKLKALELKESAKVEEESVGVILCCSSCGKVPAQGVKLLRCSACKCSNYCNIKCQKVHWSIHKLSCEEKKARRIAGELRLASATAVSEVEELSEQEVDEDVIDMTKMRLLPVNPIAYGAADQEEVIDLTGEIEEEEEFIDVTDERKKSPPPPPPPPPTLQENEECVICFEAKRTVLLLPCKQCCLCAVCSQSATECPLCRVEVKDKRKYSINVLR